MVEGSWGHLGLTDGGGQATRYRGPPQGLELAGRTPTEGRASCADADEQPRVEKALRPQGC